ncbi:MAG: hypothetical protein Ct9H300mP29_5940 [Candidatus Neomarinimicrobiota bacterium]|nr:MAG: hypothetical protein Ct9H300mP29_5940 [Candidatus Neomarinimicrobiota bacterium]
MKYLIINQYYFAPWTVPKIWDEAKKKDINISMHLPLVTEIHEEVRKLAAENRRIIIIGDHGHDEVNG